MKKTLCSQACVVSSFCIFQNFFYLSSEQWFSCLRLRICTNRQKIYTSTVPLHPEFNFHVYILRVILSTFLKKQKRKYKKTEFVVNASSNLTLLNTKMWFFWMMHWRTKHWSSGHIVHYFSIKKLSTILQYTFKKQNKKTTGFHTR